MAKQISYYSEGELEAVKMGAKIIDNGVSLVTTAGIEWCFNGIILLRETKYNTGSNKRWINHLYEEYRLKQTMMCEAMASPEFFKVYSDAVIDASYNDVDKFRKTIVRTLKKAGVEEYDAFSTIETARVLLDISQKMYDNAIEKIRSDVAKLEGHSTIANSRDYDSLFVETRPHRVYKAADKLCAELYKGKSCDLNTKESKRIFKAMSRRFIDGVYISKCLNAAAEVFPDFKNTIIIKDK